MSNEHAAHVLLKPTVVQYHPLMKGVHSTFGMHMVSRFEARRQEHGKRISFRENQIT
ncbi:hypothetical protein IE4872_PA00007 (plasmid) [Rhizobium gallicum]|uniref:Uncharacterized protein n=1 Tax=Rhizobium gallicum TaxID=56730 RepID=A0A1L5NPE5_9HYPH|nr:hypothetical protein IE4872_PA00007 [Rhizobium gallicum]